MRKICLHLSLFFIAVTVLGIAAPRQARALSGNEFDAGRIIDDTLFFNGNTMTASQIQAFLNAKVPTCDTNGAKPYQNTTRKAYAASKGISTPFICLKDFVSNTPFKAGESGLCSPIAAKSNRTAAQIIDDVAAACSVSEKALIVLLQKEQGFITDDWPWSTQYEKATGYYCPDDPDRPGWCHPEYAGFFNQVYYAALQFQRYKADPTNWNHIPFENNNVLYQENAPSCGTKRVYIQNYATAGLYNYTPYTPNKAALNNLYGTGDSCSAYGNRNFWRFYRDWFGSTSSVSITMEGYDLSTDKDGEEAKIGFRLSAVPTSDVYLDVAVHSGSNGKVVGSSKLRITPGNWNKPSRSFVRVSGLNNGAVVGTYENRLVVQKVTSSDARYNNFPVSLIELPGIVHQDTKSAPNVYRLYNSTLGKHMMTANKSDADQKIADGWRSDGTKFLYCYGGDRTIYRMQKDNDFRLVIAESDTHKTLRSNGYSAERADFAASWLGDTPVYWLYDSARSRSIYSTNPNEASASGFVNQGVAFYACSQGMTPVYQLYKPGGSRFYTSSARERNRALYESGYDYEGTSFYSCDTGTIDVHRLYKGGTGNRFYTTSTNERDTAVNNIGYRYEGVGFRICTNGTTDIYRLYRSADGTRFYTANPSLRDRFVQDDGYRYEGVGFRVK